VIYKKTRYGSMYANTILLRSRRVGIKARFVFSWHLVR
jgi:hypothetical protein